MNRPRSSRLAVKRHADPVVPDDLEQVPSGAPEDVKIARMRVAAQPLLHLKRQPVHALAHVGPADCQPHPNPARNRDHRRASAATTAAAKAGDTEDGIRIRALPANSISIAGSGGTATPSPAGATSTRAKPFAAARRSAASGRSNSASRRPDAPRLALPHPTRMPPLQSPASARRSTGDAARDQPIPRRLPSHCLLPPVQTPVVCTTAQSRHIKPTDGRRPSPDGYRANRSTSKKETDTTFAIGWKGRYRIDGPTFVYSDHDTGRVATILGYPTDKLSQTA